jgi:hypothetical protein
VDAATSLKMAQQFLLGAETALDSGGYDAAYANASVAATFAVRVLAADQSGRAPDREDRATALVDTAEANGQLRGHTARALRALFDLRWRGVFERVDHDAATSARCLASCVTATAAHRLSPRHSVGPPSPRRCVDHGASRRR